MCPFHFYDGREMWLRFVVVFVCVKQGVELSKIEGLGTSFRWAKKEKCRAATEDVTYREMLFNPLRNKLGLH